MKLMHNISQGGSQPTLGVGLDCWQVRWRGGLRCCAAAVPLPYYSLFRPIHIISLKKQNEISGF